MKYKLEMLHNLGPRNGFCIHKPDKKVMWDERPITVVKELNRLLRRIEKLEKKSKP
jgi:hypothetical protein